MTPVFQAITDTGETRRRGDCMAACLASLLDLPITAMPDFFANGEHRWHDDIHAWLRDRGLVLLTMHRPLDDCDGLDFRTFYGPPFIIALPSQKIEGARHAVVGDLWKDDSGRARFRVLHDPRPGNTPYPEPIQPLTIYFLVPISAAVSP